MANRKQRREDLADLKRLKDNKQVAEERLELLNDVIEDMKKSGGAPDIPLGGLFSDLLILNPFRAEQLLPFLRDQYAEEVNEIKQLISKQTAKQN